MDEFALIDVFFKSPARIQNDVVIGIGDDAACVRIPEGHDLLISTDTLVSGVHFYDSTDPYNLACKAVNVNISDIAAMGGVCRWITLALTLPSLNEAWLKRFSEGIHDSLNQENITLIGGDITRGPLSITITVQGIIPLGKAVQRSTARVGDKVYTSGYLGAAAFGLSCIKDERISEQDKQVLMQGLHRPKARTDVASIIQNFATAAIDISDGLSADLNHLCYASGVGACLNEDAIPVHPLLKQYEPKQALSFALQGGEDYELCFTISPADEDKFLASLTELGITCYFIGEINASAGLTLQKSTGEIERLIPKGYKHF